MASIAENIVRVKERIHRAAERAGRSPEEIRLVAVSKTVEPERILAALKEGIRILGENYVQEAQKKIPLVGAEVSWHFIGHLQSNKVKVVNDLCELVHSLDSEPAARRLAIPALLEVNLSGEASKSGVRPEEIGGFVARYPLIRGLMTMPPLTEDPETSRPYFRRLRELAEEHGLAELSMGTSQDYKVAVEEGEVVFTDQAREGRVTTLTGVNLSTTSEASGKTRFTLRASEPNGAFKRLEVAGDYDSATSAGTLTLAVADLDAAYAYQRLPKTKSFALTAGRGEVFGKVTLGGGPTVSIGRENHPVVVKRLQKIARTRKLPLQVETFSLLGGTNARVFWIAKGGIPSAVIGVPDRYMHSTVEMVDLRDVENTAALVAAFCLDLKPGEVFRVQVTQR